MSKQRIWIDMTDLNVWNGFMTGVQRVVYQNAKRFIASPDYDAHCFVFDAASRTFYEVDFVAIEAKIEATEQAASQHMQAPRGLKQLIRRAPRALIRRVPPSVKRRIPASLKRHAKRGARLSLRVARHGVHLLRKPLQAAAPTPPAITWTPADTLLIMGKSWDLPDLIPTLGRLKQSQGFRLVHLIHDMIPTLEPHLFGPGLFEPYTDCMFEVCALSDHILTVSESTKHDVARFCKLVAIPEPLITPIHLGDDVLDIKLAPDEPAPDPRVQPDFILQVGTVEVRKNHLLTYLAYREAALRGIELPQFVIMGGGGWLTGDLIWQIEHDPLMKDKIIILRGISDRGRLWLYKHCRLTVSPSTYEGWGMPIGESLAYGKVCITSTTSSTPEVGREFADYVSPYNSQEMFETLVKYTDDKALKAREQQIRKGYKPATWDTTFKQVAKAIKK